MEATKPIDLSRMSATELLSGDTVVRVFLSKEEDWSNQVKQIFELAGFTIKPKPDEKDWAIDFLAKSNTAVVPIKCYRFISVPDDVTIAHVIITNIDRLRQESEYLSAQNQKSPLWLATSSGRAFGDRLLQFASRRNILLLSKKGLWDKLSADLGDDSKKKTNG